MVFAATGSLTIKKDNLETRAKNLLKWKIANKEGSLHQFYTSEPIDEEIKFLFDNKYLIHKEGPPSLEYEITSKGREYISG